MRIFDGGATRSADTGKLDYEGFFSPLVLERYARFLHKHRIKEDGSMRASDNWQKGIPREVYMKSAWRHFMDWWMAHRGWKAATADALEEMICAVLFNATGYLHEHLVIRRNAIDVGLHHTFLPAEVSGACLMCGSTKPDAPGLLKSKTGRPEKCYSSFHWPRSKPAKGGRK